MRWHAEYRLVGGCRRRKLRHLHDIQSQVKCKLIGLRKLFRLANYTAEDIIWLKSEKHNIDRTRKEHYDCRMKASKEIPRLARTKNKRGHLFPVTISIGKQENTKR